MTLFGGRSLNLQSNKSNASGTEALIIERPTVQRLIRNSLMCSVLFVLEIYGVTPPSPVWVVSASHMIPFSCSLMRKVFFLP